MLRDLRIKARNRRSRISSCDYRDFLPLTKQFFAFLNTTPILKTLIEELSARNLESISEVAAANPGIRVYGETAEKAAAIAFAQWKKYSEQDNPAGFYKDAPGPGDYNTCLEHYREWYVEPLFEYLDEVLEDNNTILAGLVRFKHKVEWYRREELISKYENNSQQGEKQLAKAMYEFLFDLGIPFQAEPISASGRPDVVAIENSDWPFVGDVKIFEPTGGRGAAYIKKGFYQVYRYCCDHNQPIGHLIVFNVSPVQLRCELNPSQEGSPRFEYNHKTIFITVIDIHKHEATASTRGVPETMTITSDDLIREAETVSE